ncbi:MAG: AAA family ATPase [Desulfuromonadales bacterium]|nr:AAA family ATPase [Desulfuromonadales bacterium]
MANIISVISSKGGSGKTTVALNLAVALAEKGNNTLLVDIDPLGAIGLSLAKSDTEWSGVAEYIVEKYPIEDAIIKTKLPFLSILPRGRLDPLDIGLYEEVLSSTKIVQDILSSVEDRFRYIILDTPSGLGMVTRSALSASHFTLVPLQAEPLSLRCIDQTLRVIKHVKEHENTHLQLLGILATMVQLHQDTSFQVMKSIWGSLTGVLETYIPRADVFSIASEKGLPVAFLGGKYPPEALRFELLATEIENIIQELGGTTGEADGRQQRELI